VERDLRARWHIDAVLPPDIRAFSDLSAIVFGAATRNAGGAEAGLSNAKRRPGFQAEPPFLFRKNSRGIAISSV